MAEIGSVINGKYEILTQIGKGGMSVVYLAMDKHLNKQWAIKELYKVGNKTKDEIVVNSLLAETNLMKKLDHPALPRIVDIIDNGVTLYVVMDYIEGTSLDKVLEEYGFQSEEMVISWAKQICDALSYLHAQKPPIIYRDMKPANVMLKPEGNIKIIDFGIAREYKELNLSDTTVLGTKGYAPPEQYSGQTDARSDIYALGMTMHHLLTGVDPRSGNVFVPVRQWNPEISEGIEMIINKCVEPASENRYQTCADLLYDLEHPELITKGFKKMQKKKINTFATCAILGVLTLLSGIGCNVGADIVKSNNYEAYISIMSSTSCEEKIESYKNAIKLYPSDTRAYTLMLEAYENEGVFGQNENSEFLAVYNANMNSFDENSVEFARLNYKIGQMYFNYFTNSSGVNSFSSRVQKAYPFFELNYNNNDISADFKEKNISDCYYHICLFYKKYILNSATPEEVSKVGYEELFTVITDTIDDVSEYGAYDQLTHYNGVFMLLYDQRVIMAEVGVNEDDVLNLFDLVDGKALHLTVQKEQSKKLQEQIQANYVTYKEAIERAYDSKEER